MQSLCRNFSTPSDTASRRLKFLEPNILQKVAGISPAGGTRHNNGICCQIDTSCQIDTKCRFATGENRTLSRARPGARSAPASGRVNRGGVHQHDRDVVLNGVDTAAFAAFQTFPVCIQDHWLLANRADQHIKQILRDHSRFILTRSRREAAE